MPCWPVFQLSHWHRFSESCTQCHAPFWISSHVTVWLRFFESCTGCQSLRGSSTSCACWFTSRFWDTRRNISQTVWQRLPIFQVNLHCAFHRVATSSCRGHVNELATEPFLLLHREHEQATDRTKTAAIDGLIPSWSENISVSFCLWAPGYRLTLCGAPSVF